METEDTTEALIVGLYDAALDPERWGGCFAAMRGLVGASTSISSVLRPDKGEVHLLDCSAPEAFVKGYLETWWRRDLWMIEADRRRGRISVGSEMIPDAEFLRSDVYNELVKQTSDVRDVLGTVFDVGGWRMVIGLHRPVSGTYGAADKARFGRLLPHVARALEVTLRFAELDRLGRAGQAALDALAYGVVVVDPSCHPLLVNRLAAEILAAGDGFLRAPGLPGERRALATCRPADGVHLQALVRDATRTPPGPGGAMRVARTGDRPDYAVLVAPAVGRRAAVFNHGGPTAILVIQDPGRVHVTPARVLRHLYGLTAAEADIVSRLGAGSSPEEVAAARAVGIATLRSQIRAILAKTGAARLTDLARLVAALPALRE